MREGRYEERIKAAGREDETVRRGLVFFCLILLACSLCPAQDAEEIQYQSVKVGKVNCDIGILFRKLPEGGTEVIVSAIAKGKGANFRVWEVEDIKLEIGDETIRPYSSQKFYTTQSSILRYPAAVVFGAIGTQYEMYGKNSSVVLKPGAQPIQLKRTGLQTVIDKAGMTAGLGLLVTQAKGEITGLKCAFRVNGTSGRVKIVAENMWTGHTVKMKAELPSVQ